MAKAIHELFRLFRAGALTTTQAMLLLLVNEYAGSSNADACWASVPTLAWELNLSPRTLREQLDRLTEMGCLTAQARDGESTVYRVTGFVPPRTKPRPKTRAVSAGVREPAEETHAETAEDPPPNLQGDPGNFCRQVPEPVLEEVPIEAAPAAAIRTAAAPAAPPDAAAMQLLSIQEKLHPGRGLTSRDRRHLQLALQQGYSTEQLTILFAWAAHSHHPHAEAARRQGWNHLSGLCKPGRDNLELRMTAALSWWAARAPAAPPPPTPQLPLEETDEPVIEILPPPAPAPRFLPPRPPAPPPAARPMPASARAQRYAAMGLLPKMRLAGLAVAAAQEADCLYSK
jgi:DNA-binding transcriptional ArsR family regulator